MSDFQVSFILRLFREKRKNGFVKAFTDDPTRIVFSGLGQLQRLINKLYVRRVVFVPRFDAGVKEAFDINPVNLFKFYFKNYKLIDYFI